MNSHRGGAAGVLRQVRNLAAKQVWHQKKQQARSANMPKADLLLLNPNTEAAALTTTSVSEKDYIAEPQHGRLTQ